MSTARIDLSFTRPPLSMNQRMHWAQKAQITRDIRQEVAMKARPLRDHFKGEPIEVSLHWLPRDNRRRDEDNYVATLKPACDGLVDAGLVDDDTPALMGKLMPIIHPHEKGQKPACWLQIRLKETK